jgi:hypothetical protein
MQIVVLLNVVIKFVVVQSVDKLIVAILSGSVLSVIMPSAAVLSVASAERHIFIDCHYAKCRFAGCRGATQIRIARRC